MRTKRRWPLTLALGLALACAPFALGAQQSPVWHFINGVPFVSTLGVTSQVLAGDGACGSTPSYAFASDTDLGRYFVSAGIMRECIGGTARFQFWGNGFEIGPGLYLGFGTLGSAVPVIFGTAPTVTSAGTSPSVAGTNTAAFRVNVGTGGTATTIVMAMPAATTGWNCDAENITGAAANRANQAVKQQSSTTTSVTVQNQTVSTGAALAFTASDIVSFTCLAY